MNYWLSLDWDDDPAKQPDYVKDDAFISCDCEKSFLHPWSYQRCCPCRRQAEGHLLLPVRWPASDRGMYGGACSVGYGFTVLQDVLPEHGRPSRHKRQEKT